MTIDVGAVVGGCAAGGVVFIIIVVAAVYLSCRKRKQRKHREQKKFRPISPHASPAHSQPSTLGQFPETRLPKVNSTGLWIGAPSVYGAGPGPTYYYGRPHGGSKHKPDHSHNIEKTLSETRITHTRPYFAARPFYESRNNVYMIPVHGGQRIYHSQQLAPVFEMPPITPTAGMGNYDLYQYAGNNSRSKLLETKHTPNYYNTEFQLSKTRLERSKSDGQERTSGSRQGGDRQSFKKDMIPIHSGPSRQSSRDNSSSSSVTVDKRSSKSHESADVYSGERKKAAGRTNQGFSPNVMLERVSSTTTKQVYIDSRKSLSNPPVSSQTATTLPKGTAGLVSISVSAAEGMSPSATDSIELLTKNKTDDQKIIVPSVVSVVVDKENEDSKDINYHRYVYQGDIYAIPNKASMISKREQTDNPILSRMKEMVIERSRSSSLNAPRTDSTTVYKAADFQNPSPRLQSTDTDSYQKITTTTTVTASKVSVSEDSSRNAREKNNGNALDGLDLPDPSEIEKIKAGDVSKSKPRTRDYVQDSSPADVPLSVTVASEKDEVEDSTSPVVLGNQINLSPRDSLGTEGHDDINKAGKRITESAFTFLDAFLSDDDGTDTHIESPPLSPGGMRALTVAD